MVISLLHHLKASVEDSGWKGKKITKNKLVNLGTLAHTLKCGHGEAVALLYWTALPQWHRHVTVLSYYKK